MAAMGRSPALDVAAKPVLRSFEMPKLSRVSPALIHGVSHGVSTPRVYSGCHSAVGGTSEATSKLFISSSSSHQSFYLNLSRSISSSHLHLILSSHLSSRWARHGDSRRARVGFWEPHIPRPTSNQGPEHLVVRMAVGLKRWRSNMR